MAEGSTVLPKLVVTPRVLRSTPWRMTQRSKRVTSTRPTRSTGAAHQHGRRHGGGRDILEEATAMSIGVSIFLLVVGAILTFAVKVTATGFSIHTVGIILMLAGGLGLLLSLLFWSNFSPWSRRRTMSRGDTIIDERRIERDLP
jgi:hypothetical protein